MKKGYIFTMDAMIALSVAIFIILSLSFFTFESVLPEKRYENLNFMTEDTMNMLEYLQTYEVKDTPTIKSLINNGELEKKDLNKTVLDLIASFWYKGEYTVAGNISKDVLQGLTDDSCVKLEIDEETIYSSCGTSSDELAVSSRIESGYAPGETSYGYAAGAKLLNARRIDSTFLYFGGYVGEGNITGIMELPQFDEITEAYMEMNVNSNFTLFINGNYSGSYINGSAGGGNMTADKWIVCNQTYHPEYCANLTTGNNTLEFNFTANNSFIGGGYFKVTYNIYNLIPERDPNKDWHWFPGIKGFINLYDSFYVPGKLNNMTMRLHYFNNLTFGGIRVPVYVTIGDREAFRSSSIGPQDVTLDYNLILNNLGLTAAAFEDQVSNKTIPITFGTDMTHITGKGIADAVLITDISGSMDTNDVQPGNQQRLAVAKAVDVEFINGTDGILSIPGNRIGTIAYSSTPGIRRMHDMGNNGTELVAQINNYSSAGCTCISCGIQKAIDMLSLPYKIDTYVHERDFWLYNTSYPASDPPTSAGKNWNELDYNVSGWINGSAILGFDNYPYMPYVSTAITNNGGNYYFRKIFTVENLSLLNSAYLYVLSDDKADVYLNGQLIDTDPTNHNGTYWNRMDNVIFYDGFESYSGKCGRVRANDLNVAPGFWFINDSILGSQGYINLTCNKPSYPAFNGSNVLTMSNMNAQGQNDFKYIEKTLNLAGLSNVKLSYWWKMQGNFEFNNPGQVEEHGLVQVWDGQWHTVAMHNSYQDDGIYHYQEIDLSPYNMTNNFKIRFSSKSNSFNDVFSLDDVKVWTPIKIDKSKFVEGENVIAVKLYNNDAKSAKFDLKLEGNITEDRKKAMLLMSDGIANTLIPGDKQCGAVGDTAKWEAVNKSCEARNKYGINIYAVAFGAEAEPDTLNRTTCWNCTACPNTGMTCNYGTSGSCNSNGCYWNISLSPRCRIPSKCWLSVCNPVYSSNDANELKNIYRKIAKDIVELSYSAQKVNITGEVPLKNILYPDSYIQYNFTPLLIVNPEENSKISITREGKMFRDLSGLSFITDPTTKTKEGWHNMSTGATIIDGKITSYSSEYWTDRLLVNSSVTGGWKTVYNLSNYLSVSRPDYRGFGDPYIIQIPVNYLSTGNNSFRIGSGYFTSNGLQGVGGSPDSRFIYTMLIQGRVGYNLTHIFATLQDATNDAKRRLNDTIKGFGIYVEDADVNIDYSTYSGIQSLWGPSMLKVIMWKR